MEIWDLYNENRNKLNIHQVRGEIIPNGAYHLVTHVWIKNSKDEYLISKRSMKKKYPLMWECVCGSVLKDETTYLASIRETKEEVGVDLTNANYKFVTSFLRKDFQDIVDVYVFYYNGEVSLDLATTDEVIEVKWMKKDEILSLYKDKKLMHTLNYFFDLDI